jgi:hypothetical protein
VQPRGHVLRHDSRRRQRRLQRLRLLRMEQPSIRFHPASARRRGAVTPPPKRRRERTGVCHAIRAQSQAQEIEPIASVASSARACQPLPAPPCPCISKKVSKKQPVLNDGQPKEETELVQQLLFPFTSGSTRVFHMDRSDSSGSVLPLPGCKCRKNGCLRRYCSCFAQSKPCGVDCGCSGCKNDGTLRTPLKAAVARITSKNPKAFEPKFVECEELGGAVVRTGGGCSCRASNCLKRYCECFAAGASCSSSCKCTACHNKGAQ